MKEQALLEKSRIMHMLLQKAAGDTADFTSTAKQLREMLGCGVYLVDKTGAVLGYDDGGDVSVNVFSLQALTDKQIEGSDLQWLLSYSQTETGLERNGSHVMLAPVTNMGERLGTVVCCRGGSAFGGEDVLLAEYGAAITSVQLMRAINRKAENEARKKNVVQLALEVLSYSELEAVKYIFNEIEGSEGFLVASKLAEEYKLTRSVIVNALRKLESAGVIDARSLGMKGTYIKILNNYLYEELAQV